ncbi:hypothetical protein BT93_H2481 [Corymbia citriodora subsp. variegata]|nr:hypothetical protein BT93_H2481 [Corymbia citriodora subsp. variegata]
MALEEYSFLFRRSKKPFARIRVGLMYAFLSSTRNPLFSPLLPLLLWFFTSSSQTLRIHGLCGSAMRAEKMNRRSSKMLLLCHTTEMIPLHQAVPRNL